MMEGDFSDYKPGYYTVEFAQADDFRNKDKSEADLAKWGTAYAVKFKRDAGTYYWSSRTEPQEDQRVYGHVEPSKSGKSMNFRRDEDPDKGSHPTKPTSSSSAGKDSYLKDMSNTPILMYNGSLNYAKESGLNLITDTEDRRVYFEYVKDITDEMLLMIDKIRSGASEQSEGELKRPPRLKEESPPATGYDKFKQTKERLSAGEFDYGEEPAD